MNKLVRNTLIAVGLVVFINGLAVLNTNAQVGVKGEILKRMENHYKGLSSLKASVKMEISNPQLGEHDVYEGNLLYIPQKGRDAAFRIDWTKPAAESLSVVNKQYVIYRVKPKTVLMGSVNNVKDNAKANGVLAVLNMSKAQLNAAYDIYYIGLENVSGGTLTWHLQLIPKSAASYKNADIWVDGNGMPIQMKQTENNNDTTTIMLSNLNKNPKINSKDIQVIPPKGIKINKT